MVRTTADLDRAVCKHRLSVRLGDFDVAVTSDLPGVIEEVRALYDGAPPAKGNRQLELAVEVRATGRSLFRSRRYGVFCDGQPLRATLPAAEVLPHIEWGINYQMISKCRALLQLHASSLSYRGVGVVFAAPSGCGKSTLAAALLARGWGYLCDEFALIDPEDLSLRPFPKAVCLKTGAFALATKMGLPLATGRRYVKGIKGEVGYINPFALGGQAIATRCPLRFIIFPRYEQNGQPRIWSISAARAAFNLARCTLNRYNFQASGVDLFSRIASTTTAFAMQSGDLAATCELLERTIEEGTKDG